MSSSLGGHLELSLRGRGTWGERCPWGILGATPWSSPQGEVLAVLVGGPWGPQRGSRRDSWEGVLWTVLGKSFSEDRRSRGRGKGENVLRGILRILSSNAAAHPFAARDRSALVGNLLFPGKLREGSRRPSDRS